MMDLAVEFSQLASMDDVVAAYRLFLRRPPEDAGYQHYEKYIAQGMTIERLAAAFMASEEFQNLQKSDLFSVDLGGYYVCVDPKETDVAPWLIIDQDYEPHVRRAISERFREGQTFVDLGANVGCIAFHAAKIAGPSGRVIAVEPNPMNQQRLYAGIIRNGFTNVRVMPYAVSDRRTTFSLTGGTSNTYITDPKGVDVASVYTQSMIADEDLAYLPSIDFIKMDVEGHEEFALRGFAGLIRKHNPTLIAEFCPFSHEAVKGQDPMDFLNTLFELWNHMTVITRYGDNAEFTEPEPLMDYWRKRDEELSAQGFMPAGILHFDIIATNR